MRTGIAGQIRKWRVGRCLLYHVNTGLFWIYGIAAFYLSYLLFGFFSDSTFPRLLFAFPAAAAAAFIFPTVVRNPQIEHLVVSAFVSGILLCAFTHDVRAGEADALIALATRIVAVVVGGLLVLTLRGRPAP